MIMVTHDIAEAISMCDKVIVLSNRPATIKNIYAIKLEKRLISYENQPLFWYAGRDSNPRPTGS